MPLLSALEDLLQRSVSALPTVWEKLRFLGELRRDGAEYQHWGLEQKYGKDAAQAAMAEVHAGLFNEMVSSKLSELWLAANQAAYREQVDVVEYLRKLQVSEGALPEDLQGIVPEHYNFVVTNLSRVARSRSAPIQ